MFRKINTDPERIRYVLQKIDVDPYALALWEKGVGEVVKLTAVPVSEANLLKQAALEAGIDAAVSRDTVTGRADHTDVLILGTRRGLRRMLSIMKEQPIGMVSYADGLSAYLGGDKSRSFIARGSTHLLESPQVMGILNVTPDSFSDGGLYCDEDALSARLDEFQQYGVAFADIGGLSTRPGSVPVSADEEIARVLPAIKAAKARGMTVSLDTWRADVARAGLEAGADIINDISGLTFDKNMAAVIAEFGAAVCIMHIQGEPQTMQQNPHYNNLLEDVKNFLDESIEKAVKAGISENSIILDPGFGFGKTLEHNYLLLKYLDEFQAFGLPLLVGVSRKSMIGNVLNKPVDQRLAGTLAVTTAALERGADIIRAHDIDATCDIIHIIDYLRKAKLND